MKLRNKVIVITGASDGIGRAIAVRLSKTGARLALIARNQEGLDKTVAQCDNAKAYACDVGKNKELKQAIETIAADFGGIDGVINNAGVWQKLSPVEECSDETITELIQTNLAGTIFATKYCLPHLKARPEAVIVNIVSKSGYIAQEGQSVYSATKFGVRGFTEVIRVDLKGSHVKIGAVYQAGTNTQMFAKTGDDFPLEKFTEPADLADAVEYMLSRPPKMWIPELHVNYQ